MPLNDIETNVWEAIFEHTPPVLRWVLGVLTLGVFTLAGVLWRWNRADLKRVEDKLDQVAARHQVEISKVHERVDASDREVSRRLDEVNAHLIQIASNTAPKEQ